MSTLEDFQDLIKSLDKPAFVMYTASFCSPCQLIKPLFIKESKNNTKAVFIIVDMEQTPDIGIEYGINKIPVIHVFLNGEKIDEMGGADEGHFKKLIEKHTKAV